MKKVNKLLASLFLLLVFDSVSGQKTMLLPREVEEWFNKQELANTLYLNVDDYRYIRELFGINGIPRYIVISKEGRVLNDNFEMHNFKLEIGNYLPQYIIH